MKEIIRNSKTQTFNPATYLLRGRLFRKSSFDIFDTSGNLSFRAKPPAIVSSRISIFSVQGDELVACLNKISFKDAYISGVYRYEVKDTLTSEVIGGLKGIRNTTSPESVEWQILNSQMIQIGRIEQEALPPNVRYSGKPMHNIMFGFMGDEKVFLFNININSFCFEMSADFSMDGSGLLDKNLGIALAVLFASMKRTPSNDT